MHLIVVSTVTTFQKNKIILVMKVLTNTHGGYIINPATGNMSVVHSIIKESCFLRACDTTIGAFAVTFIVTGGWVEMEETLEEILEESDFEEQESNGCCCCKKTKERSEKEYRDLLNRLSRIEGQVRGIKKMLEKDAYCTEILIQVAAVNAALNSFNKVLLANHIKTCVTRDIKEGKEETVDELVTLLQKLMK